MKLSDLLAVLFGLLGGSLYPPVHHEVEHRRIKAAAITRRLYCTLVLSRGKIIVTTILGT
jgi:hypothetical protein